MTNSSATARVASVEPCSSPRTLSLLGHSFRGVLRDGRQPNSAVSLAGVACPSKTSCLTVGSLSFETPNSGTVSEQWNGAAWVDQTTAPTSPASGALTAVSCTSASACTAVGSYETAAGVQVTLVEGWNGSSWTLESTANQNPFGDQLTAVSCTSATFCLAVGDGLGPVHSFSEIWNGVDWTLQSTAALPSGEAQQLTAVSCASPNACTAVGPAGLGPAGPLVERWDGATWTTQRAPGDTGDQNDLSGVSCPSADTCVAVGTATTELGNGNSVIAHSPLIERWNGLTWSI
jgi:hypothetical protein